MRVSDGLCQVFSQEIPKLLEQFTLERELILDVNDLRSQRFLNRSIVPHVQKLSALFNRKQNTNEETTDKALENQTYWSSSSNPKNLRLAYLLAFMPGNAFRVASVFDELQRWGYDWTSRWSAPGAYKIMELGAGPATASLGLTLFRQSLAQDCQAHFQWQLIDQDQTALDWGKALMQRLQQSAQIFRQKINPDLKLSSVLQGPHDLILASYFFNEWDADEDTLARAMEKLWRNQLKDQGLMILVEPALKVQSRRLLGARRCLIERLKKETDFQVLLPCLGQQQCGALSDPDDWCHEEVKWKRPDYLEMIDRLAGLDHRRLPFSYLVISKGKQELKKWLPRLSGEKTTRHRLVSPAYRQGRDLEFYLCGQTGKDKARLRTKVDLQRGDVLDECHLRGDQAAGRLDQAKMAGSDVHEQAAGHSDEHF